MEEDITQDPEYIKGYEAAKQQEKEWEERRKTAWMQGFSAATWEKMHQRIASIEQSGEEKEYETPVSYSGKDLTELFQKVESFDERLKKLEKYTEE